MNLLYLCLFFLIVSWFYAKGMLRMFKYNFKWWAGAVVGITCVGLTTAWFVWRAVEVLTWEYALGTLILVFLSALPGMIYHGETILKEQIDTRQMLQKERTRKLELSTENARLEAERNNLKDEILPILQRVENKQNDEARILAELTGILNMRLWAKKRLEEIDN